MFISTKQKRDINETIIRNRDQIENVIKHVAKLQVDIGKSDIPNVSDLRAQNNMLHKMLFGVKGEIKNLQQQFKMLREINDLIIERVTGLEVLVRQRQRITIPKEKVQEMKDAGTWQDSTKRDSLLATYIKQKRKAEEQNQRNRESKRRYYLKKKAEKASQQSLI